MAGSSAGAEENYSAFLWTPQAGFVELLPQPSPAVSTASAITPDGQAIVGTRAGADGDFAAIRWSANDLVSETQLALENWCDISADKAVLIGNAPSTNSSGQIWDLAHGVRRLRDVSDELGLGSYPF